MKYLYEYRSTSVRKGAPILLPKEEFQDLSGFISLFGFPQDAADYINDTGATRGVGKHFPLYADTLKLDFDDAPDAEKRALGWLKEKGINHRLYRTGNRGHHIHIDIEPMEMKGLSGFFASVVSSLFPGADINIYKPTGIIRLPGTYHAKTGGKMELVEEYKGTIMHLMSYKRAIPVPLIRDNGSVDKEQLDYWLTRDLNKSVGKGDRNTHIFSLAATAQKLELDYNTAVELISNWNQAYCNPPVRGGEMMATIRSAYR